MSRTSFSTTLGTGLIRLLRLTLLTVLVLAGMLPFAQPATVSAATGTITGQVFKDFNGNGAFNITSTGGTPIDIGVAGVAIRAYDITGAQVGTATSAANGTYTISVGNAKTTAIRVEFSTPAGLLSGPMGANNGSSVQFVTLPATNVSYGLLNPIEYCQNNPRLVTCVMDRGAGTVSNGAISLPSALKIGNTSTQLANSDNLGAVFGVGTDRNRNIYYGTYAKRHIEYGSAGATNTIYRVNADIPGTVSTFVTLPGTLPVHSAAIGADLPAALQVPYLDDRDYFDKPGRFGLGDVDVTPDGTKLLAVDMNEAAPKLYVIPISGSGNSVTAGTSTSYNISKPATFNGVPCVGTWHPMGIAVRGSRILVGGVCGAETTITPTTPRGPNPTQSAAFVLEFNGSTFATIYSLSLGYPRGCGNGCTSSTSKVGSYNSADWSAWNTSPTYGSSGGSTNPQAMLSNIEISDSGDLILGFRDRHADMQMTNALAWHQAYTNASYPKPPRYPAKMATTVWSAGDLRRACYTSGTYTSEGAGTCTALPGSKFNPNGTREPDSEYYYDNYRGHEENPLGSLATLPGFPGVWGTAYDVNGFFQQGLELWGNCNAATETCLTNPTNTGYGWPVNGTVLRAASNIWFKGNGLGDLEFLCDSAPIEIGNRVWFDLDNDGVQDADETPIAGVTVKLYDSADAVVATAVTDTNGTYLFSSGLGTSTSSFKYALALKPATDYSIRLDNPADSATATSPLYNMILTKANIHASPGGDWRDSDATLVSSYPRIDLTTGVAGASNHTFDIGFSTAGLGNFVWVDTDKDGLQDASEPGMAGVTVQLFNPSGVLFGTTTTDASGKYQFSRLVPGTYFVKFTLPRGYAFTTRDATGTTDANDSDVSPTTGNSANITLTVGQFNLSVDAGLLRVASLGNFVWLDLDKDGKQDVGESGVPGVTVQLLNSNGTERSATTTDANGLYSFGSGGQILPGTYSVKVTLPGGYSFTTRDSAAAGDTLDSDVDPATGKMIATTLSAGERDMTWDAGLVQVLSLGNLVFNDRHNNGVYESARGDAGINGVTVTLYRDVDGNGLLTAADGAAIATTTTGGGGLYLFDGLRPGEYLAHIPESNFATTAPAASLAAAWPLAGLTNTVGESDPDTDINHDDNGIANAEMGGYAAKAVTLTSGGEPIDDADNSEFTNLSVDFGFYAGALGNYVWLDTNKNGLQDASETGVAGVTVTLYAGDGTTVITSTTTAADGYYWFDMLRGGQYRVTFTPPAGYSLTSQNQGSADAADSDADPVTGQTSVTTLDAGEIDPTWDAGLVLPDQAAGLGDYVWFDANKNGVQDGGEIGMAGVTIRLYADDGSLRANMTTDSAGAYRFQNLAPGSYQVQFIPPTRYMFTQPTQTSDSADSNVAVLSGRTARFSLIAGQHLPTIDAGLVYDPTAVALTNFQVAEVTDTAVTLTWTTASEVNSYGFAIYRSATGSFGHAQKIGFVASTGTAGRYSYQDLQADGGPWWYWLVEIDASGAETPYGPVTTSTVPVGEGTYMVYMPLMSR